MCKVVRTHFLLWKTLTLTPLSQPFPRPTTTIPWKAEPDSKAYICQFIVSSDPSKEEWKTRENGKGGKDNVMTMTILLGCWALFGQLRFNPSRTFWGTSIIQSRTLSLKDEEGGLYSPIPSHLWTRNYQELLQEVSTSLNFQFCACQSGE